nr:hypothetical protein [uncultured Cellulosilyticum sp.]
MALYKIKLANADKVNKLELEKAVNEIDRLKNKPDGVYELVWHFFQQGEALSYKNDRILWLGWQLEKRGIKVSWCSC